MYSHWRTQEQKENERAVRFVLHVCVMHSRIGPLALPARSSGAEMWDLPHGLQISARGAAQVAEHRGQHRRVAGAVVVAEAVGHGGGADLVVIRREHHERCVCVCGRVAFQFMIHI